MFVPDVELEVLTGPTHAAQLGQGAGSVEEGVTRHGLGQAVGVREPRRGEGPAQALDVGNGHLLSTGDDQPNRREVPLLDAGNVQGRPDHRRSQPHAGHSRPLDLVDDGLGIEHTVDNGRCTHRDHRGGDEVERTDVVQGSAGQTDVGIREAELGDMGVVLPRQVCMGDHDALRAARGPGRVGQPVDVVAMDLHARRTGGTGNQVGKPHPPREAPGRRAHPEEVAVQLARRFVGELDEAVIGHERPSSGVVQDVPHLVRSEPPVDRHRNRSDVVGGEDRGQELDAVVGEQADDVAGTDSLRQKPACQGGCPVGHSLVGDDVVAEDREWVVRGAAGVVLEHADPAHIRVHQGHRRRRSGRAGG